MYSVSVSHAIGQAFEYSYVYYGTKHTKVDSMVLLGTVSTMSGTDWIFDYEY